MEKLVLKIKNQKKLEFLIELLKQFDFVEILKERKTTKSNSTQDFFSSAGLWKGREIEAKELRKNAWKK